MTFQQLNTALRYNIDQHRGKKQLCRQHTFLKKQNLKYVGYLFIIYCKKIGYIIYVYIDTICIYVKSVDKLEMATSYNDRSIILFRGAKRVSTRVCHNWQPDRRNYSWTPNMCFLHNRMRILRIRNYAPSRYMS